MWQLRFEKDAKKMINFWWEHGRVADFWSIVHLLTWFIIWIVAYLTWLPFISLFFIITILLIGYELFEMKEWVIEDIWNSLADVIIWLIWFIISYFLMRYIEPNMFYIILFFMVIWWCIWILDYIGYKTYIKRAIKDTTTKEYVYVFIDEYKVIFCLWSLLIVWFIAFFDVKYAIATLWLSYIIFSYLFYKKKLDLALLIAFLFAFFVTSHASYYYDSLNIFIGNINLFPLISRTAALILLRDLYHMSYMKYKLLCFSLLYLIILFSLEYIWYYYLWIHIDKDYPSLLWLGIIHGPLIIHIFYPSAGIVYLVIMYYVDKYLKTKDSI